MPNNVYYTSAQNMTSYSDSIQTVAYDNARDLLHVVWQSNPDRVYSYFGLPSAYSKIIDKLHEAGSIRSLVKDVTDTLQREGTHENAKLVQRRLATVAIDPKEVVSIPLSEHSNNSPFLVTLQVDAEYQFEINALDFNDAAAKATELFSQHVTSGGPHVVGVKKA
jgi:hypothetical protein